MSDKIKTYCYNSNCGPIVKTGAVQSTWIVCKSCKNEISERLAEEIKNRKPKEEPKEEPETGELWGMGFNKPDDEIPW